MGAIYRRLTNVCSFSEAIRKAQKSGRMPVIVDIKPVSPRDGNLLNKRRPMDLGRLIKTAGACAVSVVTESGHFGGSIDMLREITRTSELPVLQKDFFSDTSQVVESHEAGAGAFLLIMATTSDAVAQKLYRKGMQLGMEAVVEIHTAEELERALRLEPKIIGINNRDIKRLELDTGDVRITENLAPLVPDGIVTISESALLSRDDVLRAAKAGADAVLIGTAVLQADDIAACIKEFTTA